MPVDLPIAAFSGIDVGVDLGIVTARSTGGLVIASRRHDAFWRGTWTTGILDWWERADFLAWLTWAADLNMRVDIVHPRHRYPRDYNETTWPMAGDGALVDTPDQRTLSVSGILAGVQLRRGDRVSVLQDDIVVHRWIAADTLVTSAISQNIPVTPLLPIGVLAPAAIVRLQNPPLRSVIVAGSWESSQAEEYGPTPISFEVMEALR